MTERWINRQREVVPMKKCVPMDKFMKQSQKTDLWARRRNNTASKMLEGQLSHLERGYYRGYRQYLRDKTRVQVELRELESIIPDFDVDEQCYTANNFMDASNTPVLPKTPLANVSRQNTADLPRPKWIRREKTMPNIVVGGKPLEEREIPSNSRETDTKERWHVEPKDSKPGNVIGKGKYITNNEGNNIENQTSPITVVSPSSHRLSPGRLFSPTSTLSSIRPTPIFNLHTSEPVLQSEENHTANDEMTTSTPRQEVVSQKSNVSFLNEPKSCSARSTSSAHSTCRYSPDPTAKCHHFPCTKPVTYHTLGLRRNDLLPWTSDVYNTGTTFTEVDERVWELDDTLNDSENNAFNTSMNSSMLSSNSSQDIRTLPRWTRRDNHQRFRFRPINGPLFEPKPSDPILERVREGVTKSLPMPPSGARVAIQDKLRGLRHLVTEMREKVERTRPVDRAINYGAKLPRKVLLNPVIPVKLNI